MNLDRQRWESLWRRVAALPPREASFDAVVRRYAEPERHYHDAAHIAACLAWFDEVRDQIVDPVAVELAVWLHDVIYDARVLDNEERSADFARAALLKAGAAGDLVRRVAALILTTKSHEPGSVRDAPWLLDIDLAILGQAAETFAAYDAGIRAEYAWVDPATYVKKRREVLERFLSRPRIYYTDYFRVRFEATARANLVRAIERLEGAVG